MANLDLKPMPEDMSQDEQELLKEFLDNGCPGLAKIADSDIFQWFQLYMMGKTYSEIAIATKKKTEFILFMSYKQNWLEKKMKHFDDLLNNIEDKLKQTKIESLNTVTTIVNALGHYYGDQFLKYMTSKDPAVIENIDTKMLSQYYKSIEAIDKIIGNAAKGDGASSPGPLVNLNFNSADTTVEQIDEKTLNITDNKQAGNLLKLLAEAKKSEKK